MRVAFDIGLFKINISQSGGLRVSMKNKGTYISQQLVKPNKKKGADIIEI